MVLTACPWDTTSIIINGIGGNHSSQDRKIMSNGT